MKFDLTYFCVVLGVLFLFFDNIHADVLPIEGDCTKYQICDQNGCFLLSCGDGTEFNPKIKVCDYPLQDRTSCRNRPN
ncbi:PREDICTED: peritrophin-1-like [Ceratosolen solmsi marchali]|uniref:Peritrophin-1-like n=1 Tax=Ceratosolen solmsi marchali TaxID=326594 RepID=A0AAJ6YKS0_9HYME|nr:PREDICTED: peritrophin-1-like [Ceratosolen solmsi marchali]